MAPVISAHLKNGRDEHGVCIGKAKKGRLGVSGLFETGDGPDHSRVLDRSVVETRSSFGFGWLNERRAYSSAQFQSVPSFRLVRETPGACQHCEKLVRECWELAGGVKLH